MQMHCYAPPPPSKPPTLAPSSSSSSYQIPNPIINRRDLTSQSLMLGFIGSISIHPLQLRAETTTLPVPAECPQSLPTTKEAFLDVSIDGEGIGRIVIGLYSASVPLGASRFAELVSGKSGASYRRKEFVKIMPNYIQHAGLRSFGVDAEVARSNLGTAEGLLEEWRKQQECKIKNVAESVSIIVRNPTKPPPKLKLVARKGRLEIDEEAVGVEPNGTEFTIAVQDSPELEEAALVIGRVVHGMDVVERIASVTTVQENSSSPYFRVAKLIGDNRAVVAERGFNRPYSKVIITNCGLVTA